MKFKKPLPQYVNVVTVNGEMIGTFVSEGEYHKIGSKRSIVELIFGEYHPETNITIKSDLVSNLRVLKAE